jgi:ESF2/ABP1 family protein
MQVRHLLEKFAEIGRIYLTPEDAAVTRRRRKMGGNKRVKYEDGWVEFADKKKARQVAAMLNGQPIGSKNRGFYEHDLWTIKYVASASFCSRANNHSVDDGSSGTSPNSSGDT